LVTDLGFAAAESRKELEHFEFAGGIEPDPAGGCAKEGSSLAGVDLHVGRECISPQYRFRGHLRTAKRSEA